MLIGKVIKDVVIRAGESVLSLTGNSLPDPKIYSSEAMDVKVTVSLAQIGKTISQEVKVLPRSLDHALIRAANPIRSLLTTVNTSWSWAMDKEAMAYEVKGSVAGVEQTKIVLSNAYNWIGSAIGEVKALTSQTQIGILAWGSGATKTLQLEIASSVNGLRKGFTEITLAGAVVGSFIISEFEQNGQWGLWLTDGLGAKTGSQQVASVDNAGVITFSDANLIRELAVDEIAYSASFVTEKSVIFAPLDTSAGPTDDELLQFDKYFYFEAKVGDEGPTKFFANAPVELDLAAMDVAGATSWLDQNRDATVDFDFYAANALIYLNDVRNGSSQPDPIVFNSDKVVMYADKMSFQGALGVSAAPTTELNILQKDSVISGQNKPLESLTLLAGKDGIGFYDIQLNLGGADLNIETSAGVIMDRTAITDVGNKFEVSAATSLKMGAEGSIAPVTVQAKSETANSMAVIRTGDSLELRRVVLKSFARGEIVSVSAANKGRVLLSAATARDFRINELVNAVIVADNKGQTVTTSPDIVAQGVDLMVEGSLPIKTAKYNLGKDASGIDQFADVHGHNVNLEASRIALSGARITAINAITAKAQTLVVDSSILRVVNALGSINLYSRSGYVNPQYGTVVEGMVNFSGSNTFQIGAQTVSISSAQDLQNALGRMVIEGASAPLEGKINILPVNNVSAASTSQLN